MFLVEFMCVVLYILIVTCHFPDFLCILNCGTMGLLVVATNICFYTFFTHVVGSLAHFCNVLDNGVGVHEPRVVMMA